VQLLRPYIVDIGGIGALRRMRRGIDRRHFRRARGLSMDAGR